MEQCKAEAKEDEMVVLLEQDLDGLSREDFEAITNDMGARENPPAGLIAHVIIDRPGGAHIVDIWESEADLRRFAQEQLIPSMKKVSQERGFPMPDPFPQPQYVDAYDLVRAR